MSSYWLSEPPETCDTCDTDITNTFIDGKTAMGPWAFLCPSCFHFGPGTGRLGTGWGQKYEKQPDGKWLKTAG